MPHDNCAYDVIIDRNALRCLSLDVSIINGVFEWKDLWIPMVVHGYWTENWIRQFCAMHLNQINGTVDIDLDVDKVLGESNIFLTLNMKPILKRATRNKTN